jgi:hypothetical protein
MARILSRLTIAFYTAVILSSALAWFIYQGSIMSDTVRYQLARPLCCGTVVGIGAFLMVYWAFRRGQIRITRRRQMVVLVWSVCMIAAYFSVATMFHFYRLPLGRHLLLMFASGVVATVVWYSVTWPILSWRHGLGSFGRE